MKNTTSSTRLHLWLNNIPVTDPVNRRMASFLQIILLGLLSIFFLAGLLSAFITPNMPGAVILIRTFLTIIIFGIPLILLRLGYFRGSVFFIISLLLLLESYAVFNMNLRNIAETLAFFTLANLLAGLMMNRRTLILTSILGMGAVVESALREQDIALRQDSIVIAVNFVLLNGLITLFLDRFGATLHTALNSSLERENELYQEVNSRSQAESALQQTNARLEILHEIDRSLLSAHALQDLALNALVRIRQLIPCPRASVTLLDFEKREASFLTADFEGKTEFAKTPISFEEFGQRVIDTLLENKPWFSEDILQDPQKTDLDQRLARETGIQVWLSLPLMAQGKLIGVLNLGRPPGQPFTMNDAEIAHDIANQLAIALQHTNLYNALQAELAQREKLIAQLESSNAELERFTYTVSHDLRNPLVTIKGFLGMLDKDIKDNRQDKIQEDFRRIAGAADKMDSLLSELLELSRIGRIVNSSEEIDFGQLTQEAVETLDARLRSSHINVKISPNLPIVYGDRIRLREVLENLIDNAAKYMGEQRNPLIEVGVRDQEKAPVIYVRDNGIGIEEKYHARIFTLFEKLNPTIEGTGIGLALIKRIVEIHGGRIWVESDGPGKGSTFCFTIPDGRMRS